VIINNDKIECRRAVSMSYQRMLLSLVVMTGSVVSASNINLMNKISLILIFTSLSILVGDKLLLSYVSAQVTNGDHAPKRSNNASTALSANSVNNANVTRNTTSFRR